MAKNDTAAQELETQINQLFTEIGWETFGTQRKKELDVIRRKAKVNVDSNLAAWEDGIDPQSALLMYDRAQHMQILTMDPSKIDVIAIDGDNKDALQAAERKRMYLASLLNQMNDNGLMDDAWAQGVTDTGVIVFRLHFKMPPEMPEEERDKRVTKMRGEDEDDTTYETKKPEREDQAREDYFRDYDDKCFWVQPIGVGQYGYMPLNDNPDLFIQKSEIPYIHKRIKSEYGSDKGKYLTLDDHKQIAWHADPQAPDGAMNSLTSTDTLTYFVRDALVDDYREITEYVCVGADYKNAEIVNQYRSPLKKRCSFFPVAAGNEVPLEPNPLDHYLSKMGAEIATIGELNYLKKHVTILARRASMRGHFLDASRVDPALVPWLREMGWTEGMQGAQQGWVMPVPEPSDNELALMPGSVFKWPDNVDEHLAMLIVWARDDLQGVRPNRLLIGDYISADEPDTASSKLSSQQAAALPYGKDHQKEATFKRQLLDAVCEIIVAWDDDSPSNVQKKYYMVGTGDEPTLVGPVEPGSTAYVTADDCRRRHFIKVENKNMTLQEQLLNNQESRTKFDRHEILFTDHLRNIGNDNPQDYKKKLDRDRIELQRQPRSDALIQQEIEEYISILSGRDLAALSGGPVPPTLTQESQKKSTQQGGTQMGFGAHNGTAPLVPSASGNSVGAI